MIHPRPSPPCLKTYPHACPCSAQHNSPTLIAGCCADTEWFATGEATPEQAKELVVQFSVFSNLFLLAQLRKVLNAPTLTEMREGKEVSVY